VLFWSLEAEVVVSVQVLLLVPANFVFSDVLSGFQLKQNPVLSTDWLNYQKISKVRGGGFFYAINRVLGNLKR
jgi:hypothetical protein